MPPTGARRARRRPSSSQSPQNSRIYRHIYRNTADTKRSVTQEQLEYAHDSAEHDLAMYNHEQSKAGSSPNTSGNQPVVVNNPADPATTHRSDDNMLNKDFNYVIAGFGESIDETNKKKKRDALAAGSGGQAIAGFSESEGLRDISEAGLIDFEPEEATSLTGHIPVTEGQKQLIDYLLTTVDDNLAWVALVVMKEYGLPPKDEYAEFMSQFAESGLDDESDRRTLELLNEVRYSDWDEWLEQVDLGNDLWVEAHASHSMMWEDGIVSEEEQASYDGSFEEYKEQVELIYGVEFTSEKGADEWDLIGVRMVHIELENVARISAARLRAMTDFPVDDATAFRLIFGDLTFNRSAQTRVTGEGHPVAAEVSGHEINIYRKEGHNRNYHLEPYLFLHELGHVFNAHAGQGNPLGYGTITRVIADHTDTETRAGMGWPRKDILLNDSLAPTKHTDDMHRLIPLHEYLELEPDDPLITTTGLKSMYVQLLQQSRDYSNNEIAADTYLNYIVHLTTRGQLGFSPDAAGQERLNFMNDNMDKWIRNAIFYNAADDPHVKRFLEERGVLLPIAGSGVVETRDDLGAILRSDPSRDAEFVKYLAENSAVTLLARTQYVDDKDFYWNAIEDSGVYWTRYDLVTENWDDDIPYLSRDEVSATFNPGRPYEETAGWFSELVEFLLARR